MDYFLRVAARKSLFFLLLLSLINVAIAEDLPVEDGLPYDEYFSEDVQPDIDDDDADINDPENLSDDSDPDIEIKKENFKQYGLFLCLDKLDHSTHELEVNVGSLSQYRNLDIMLLSCWESNKNDHDSRALIKVSEKEEIIFYGWIFSNSPSLSGIEHPKYYIKLLGCGEGKW